MQAHSMTSQVSARTESETGHHALAEEAAALARDAAALAREAAALASAPHHAFGETKDEALRAPPARWQNQNDNGLRRG